MESASTTSNTPTPDPLDLLDDEQRARVEHALNSATKVKPNPDAQWTPVPPESPAKAIARKLLSIAALEKLLTEQKTALRAQALALLPDPGDRAAVTLPDGSKLGNVRTDPGTAGGWRVTDAGALRAWVEANVPGGIVEQVTTVVDPELVDELLRGIDVDNPVETVTVNPATGEVVPVPPGIAYVPAGKPTLKVTPDRAAPAALRTILGAPALQQLGIEA